VVLPGGCLVDGLDSFLFPSHENGKLFWLLPPLSSGTRQLPTTLSSDLVEVSSSSRILSSFLAGGGGTVVGAGRWSEQLALAEEPRSSGQIAVAADGAANVLDGSKDGAAPVGGGCSTRKLEGVE
jgi:hypothetical protein